MSHIPQTQVDDSPADPQAFMDALVQAREAQPKQQQQDMSWLQNLSPEDLASVKAQFAQMNGQNPRGAPGSLHLDPTNFMSDQQVESQIKNDHVPESYPDTVGNVHVVDRYQHGPRGAPHPQDATGVQVSIGKPKWLGTEPGPDTIARQQALALALRNRP